jgi:hypothetical protein
LYVRAFSYQVAPITAGYDYGAKWGIAPTGLPPVSIVASLAAPPPKRVEMEAFYRVLRLMEFAAEFGYTTEKLFMCSNSQVMVL